MAVVAPTRALRLSRNEERVLVALSHRPLGLYPASVVAAADLSAPEAAAALEGLAGVGLVECEVEPVPSRPVRRERIWRLAATAWRVAGDVLRHTQAPGPGVGPMPERVPERFGHLFWSGDVSAYRLPRDATFVAERILTNDDVTSWGWALFALPVEALEAVACRPHVPRDRRDLAADAARWRRDNP